MFNITSETTENYNPGNVNWIALSQGLLKYNQIMNMFHSVNVMEDAFFQQKFNGFYRIRQRPKVFYDALYEFLEKNKSNNVNFENALRFLYLRNGSIEPSFSSKMIATINPKFPVWDSIVIGHLGLKKPLSSLSKELRLKGTVKVYDSIVSYYDEFLGNSQAKCMLSDFNSHFPDSKITDIKKIDLMLWQTRD